MNGSVTLTWATGDHEFNVAKLKLRMELEELCGAGTQEMLRALTEGRARFGYIRETIRLGLIGGGKSPEEALLLVRRYVDDSPRAENAHVAAAVLAAEIVGIPGDQPGKKAQADQTAKGSPSSERMGDSSGPPSTGSEPLSGSTPDRSMRSPSGSLRPASTGTTTPTEQRPSPRL